MKLSLVSTGAEPAARFFDHIKLAELLGFHAFFHGDRKWTREVFSRLGAATQCTSRLGLGACALDPYTRHPALVAQAAATLAEMAPGRFRLVMGPAGDFETLPGYGGLDPLAGLREAVDLVRRLLRGETVTLDGEAVKFQHGALAWKPAAIPPLYIAGREPQILELAGRVADGVMIDGLATASGVEQAKQHILPGLQAAGRDWKDIRLCSALPVAVLEREGDPVPEGLADFALVGTGAQVIERLKALAAAGVQEIAISPFPAPGQDMEDFMFRLVKDVLPYFSEQAARAS